MAIPDLVQRLYRVATERTPVILTKVTVCDTLAERLTQEGFNVIKERDFADIPAQTWQNSFQFQFREGPENSRPTATVNMGNSFI